MQTMEDKLTEELRRLAEDEAGLEFVTSAGDGIRTWYVMDGFDTRMTIYCDFESDHISMSLIGQAANEPGLDFFEGRQLYPETEGITRRRGSEGVQVHGSDRTVNLAADYNNGERLRRMLGVVRDLLAPYAKNSGAKAPQDP